MEPSYTIALYTHIATGFLSLLSGLIAIITKKGSKKHRLSGKLFFINMLLVSITAVYISVLKDNSFLLYIGIFAFYQNYNGYRAIKNKSLRLNWADILILIIAGINAIAMLFSSNIVLMVFGGISIFLIIGQLRIAFLIFRGQKVERMQWLRQHIGMMMGAYIATVTAFLVVNIKTFDPFWLPWLAPTFIFVPLLVYWTRKYTNPKKKVIV